MGLDMFLTDLKEFRRTDASLPVLEDGYPIESHRLSLGHWRKHHALNAHIVLTYAPWTEGDPL